jgi:hypothetical protein
VLEEFWDTEYRPCFVQAGNWATAAVNSPLLYIEEAVKPPQEDPAAEFSRP